MSWSVNLSLLISWISIESVCLDYNVVKVINSQAKSIEKYPTVLFFFCTYLSLYHADGIKCYFLENFGNPFEVDFVTDFDFNLESLNIGTGTTDNIYIHERTDEDKPLYEGSPITVAVSVMLIMTFVMRHTLTGVALSDLFTLIELHCIVPSYCQRSLKTIQGFFTNLKHPLEYHYFCNKKGCLKYIGTACRNDCAAQPCYFT